MKHTVYLAYCSTPLSIDEDFVQRQCRQEVWGGEHRLMLALLQDAINCYYVCLWARDMKGKELFRETEQWIMEKNSDCIYSFENVCKTLGLNSSYLRQSLIRRKESPQAKRNRRFARGRKLGKYTVVR